MDTRFVRDFDVRLECPTDDLIRTPRSEVQSRFYDRLHDLVASHTNTLVFTNTRSGAERVLHNLREGFDDIDESNSGCHHGSLSKERRQEIESKLKAGELRVVTTSTSLELGIDMPHIDLVVQVGSPKSVAALLQRVGRAGHQLGQTVEGRVIALDRDELVECAVMLSKAESGFVDRVFIPENAFDVAAQQVYGMAINAIRPESELRETLRRAYPYRNFSDDDFERLFRYLTADYDGLEDKNVYAKIWRDTNDPPDGEHHYEEYPVGEPLIGKRGRMARVIYMTNIGTIPDSFTCDVLVRGADQWVGTLDEGYLDTLEKGDVFVLGGDHFAYRYRRGSKVYVDRTAHARRSRRGSPSASRCRTTSAARYAAFRADCGPTRRRRDVGRQVWLRTFPVDENSVRAVARMFREQVRLRRPRERRDARPPRRRETLDRDAYRRQFHVHCDLRPAVQRRPLAAPRVPRRPPDERERAGRRRRQRLFAVDAAQPQSRPRGRPPRPRPRGSRSRPAGRPRRDRPPEALLPHQRDALAHDSQALQGLREVRRPTAGLLRDAAVVRAGPRRVRRVEETYREILEDKLNVAGIETILRRCRTATWTWSGPASTRRRHAPSASPR